MIEVFTGNVLGYDKSCFFYHVYNDCDSLCASCMILVYSSSHCINSARKQSILVFKTLYILIIKRKHKYADIYNLFCFHSKRNNEKQSKLYRT